MRKLRFWWKYLTDSSFRFWCDMDAEQKFVDQIRRMMEEQKRYESKIYWQEHAPTGYLSHDKYR